MKKAALVIGTKDNLNDPQLLEALSDQEIVFKPVPFTSISDLKSQLKILLQEEWVCAFACGGDGTLRCIVEAFSSDANSNRLPLGVIPMGTANDFARSSAFGTLGLKGGIKRSLETPPQLVDVAYANGKPFINVASGGDVTKITTDASKPFKGALGKLAYYLNALAKIPEIKSHELDFTDTTGSGGWRYSGPCAAFAVANSSTAGGGLKVGPDAKIDDGLLDLLIVPSQPFLDLTAITKELLKEQPQLDDKQIIIRQTKAFSLRATEDIQINLDGEPIEGREFEFCVRKAALRMLVSPENLS